MPNKVLKAIVARLEDEVLYVQESAERALRHHLALLDKV